MKYAYFNDRPLYGQRTGVGHYLDLVRAHWPSERAVELRGLSESVTSGRISRVSDPFSYPHLSGLGRLELHPLKDATIPHGSSGDRLTTRLLRRGYEKVAQRGIVRASRSNGFGLYFEPNHLPGADVHPCVATIHDLSVLELPQYHPSHRVDWWRRRMERAMDSADRFICVSQATADAMIRVLGCNKERLSVIPLASRWGAAPQGWEPDAVRAQLRTPDRYWLHVGTIEPRKNVVRLLDAYAALGEKDRERSKLILCGRIGWGDAEFWSTLRSHPMSSEVLCTGYCEDAQVAGLMVGSSGVLCPSHYEGFGLPTIEAMTLGVGAVISDAPSLVEITKGTVNTVDAEDTEGWAGAMLQLGESADAERIQKAQMRAGEYSWEMTAQGHHDLFAELIGQENAH